MVQNVRKNIKKVATKTKKIAPNIGVVAKQVPVSEIVGQTVTETVQPKKKNFWEKLGDAAMGLAKNVIPTALSMVPVAGPALSAVAQNMLSTENDDEWFGEFKAAGATFNEMLMCTSNSLEDTKYGVSGNVRNMLGAFATYGTMLNFGDKVRENVFPAFLAQIRAKTNNVLVDDVTKYWYALADGAQLYAIYYNLQKYLKFASNIPLNAPTVTEFMMAANPRVISQLSGLSDTLRDFLKTSVKIPYALSSYLRWRYGTIFLSENSAKAGLISYDITRVQTRQAGSAVSKSIEWTNTKPARSVNDAADRVVEQITEAISAIKYDLLQLGRANADIFVALSAHSADFTVDDRHYDEKEFNLRMNLTTPFSTCTTKNDTVRLLLDSRLDLNAAIQATSISTLPTKGYGPGIVFDYHDNMVNFDDIAFIHILDTIIYANVTGLPGSDNLGGHLRDRQLVDTGWAFVRLSDTTGIATDNTRYPIITTCFSYDQQDGEKIKFRDGGLQSRVPTTLSQYALSICYKVLSISMQMHYNDTVGIYSIGNDTTMSTTEYFQIAPLSYDTALVTSSQLEAIQRQCLRNLFRANYAHKESNKDEIVESIKDVVTASGGDAATVEVV